MKEEKLERIVLVGNGFDRSLNMSTGYSHFIDWLILEALSNLSENSENMNEQTEPFFVENSLFKVTTNQLSLKHWKSQLSNYKGYKFLNEFSKGFLYNKKFYLLQIIPLSSFTEELLNHYRKNEWIDIEEFYYNYLLKINSNDIVEFHKTFNVLKKKLKEYLLSLELSNTDTYQIMNGYRKHFFGNILKYNSEYKVYEESNKAPSWFYFVNFNYTSFLTDILDNAPHEVLDNITINHIHGDLIRFPIIFGYGNEVGKEYESLEKKGNDYLENIKSTHYFNTTHYKDLIDTLSKPYEVYIYGLSCGLSDQILLKRILQNDNCKQIRVFYYEDEGKKNNFRETIMNISRVFDNKESMREKIISFQETDSIPQTNNQKRQD
jgi:hypothetical protein